MIFIFLILEMAKELEYTNMIEKLFFTTTYKYSLNFQAHLHFWGAMMYCALTTLVTNRRRFPNKLNFMIIQFYM
jgi:hypothetical protein